MVVSSSSNEKEKLENAGPYCSQESCRELHKRVESLEKTVKAILSSLFDGNNQKFTTGVGENMLGNQVEQFEFLSTLLPDWIEINVSNIEENHQPAKTLSNSKPKAGTVCIEGVY